MDVLRFFCSLKKCLCSKIHAIGRYIKSEDPNVTKDAYINATRTLDDLIPSFLANQEQTP